MSTASPVLHVSVEEYLASSYRPDKEYVDGALVDRSKPTIPHSVLQMVLIEHFAEHRKTLGFLTLPEVRTQIVEGARYRVPDIILCGLPLPSGNIVTAIPWAVIEILSPEDTTRQTLGRFHDYATVGVPQIVLLDPERYVAHRYDAGSLIQVDLETLPLPGGISVPFATREIFERLQQALQGTVISSE
jgi:Uma2 family endonuclease